MVTDSRGLDMAGGVDYVAYEILTDYLTRYTHPRKAIPAMIRGHLVSARLDARVWSHNKSVKPEFQAERIGKAKLRVLLWRGVAVAWASHCGELLTT